MRYVYVESAGSSSDRVSTHGCPGVYLALALSGSSEVADILNAENTP